MKALDYSFSSLWFYWVIILFASIGLCWLPVLVIQYRLRKLALASMEKHHLDPRLHRLMRLWIALGIPAFLAILVTFYFMVFKPLPVV